MRKTRATLATLGLNDNEKIAPSACCSLAPRRRSTPVCVLCSAAWGL